MFIELIDLLRCPVDHEDSWLVAAFTRMNGRFVIEGKLGCPVCSASYPITKGKAVFADTAPSASEGSGKHDDVIRTAALLGLTRPGALVVLEGDAASLAAGMSELVECRIFGVNAHESVGESDRVGLIVSNARFPIAAGSVDGMVMADDETGFTEAMRVLRPGGRIVAPADSKPGPAFRELARDDRSVVAELVGPLVTLSAKTTKR